MSDGSEFTGLREISRLMAFYCLYIMDVAEESFGELKDFEWYFGTVEFDNERGDLPTTPEQYKRDAVRFAGEIVSGIVSNLQYIDPVIEEFLVKWNFERLHLVDKAILRLGVYSLRYRFDIPSEVILYESNDLAAAYSEEDSYRYINGILHSVKEKFRRNVLLDQIPVEKTVKKRFKLVKKRTEE